MATTASPNGVTLIGDNEGFVSKFYRDAGGVGNAPAASP